MWELKEKIREVHGCSLILSEHSFVCDYAIVVIYSCMHVICMARIDDLINLLTYAFASYACANAFVRLPLDASYGN